MIPKAWPRALHFFDLCLKWHCIHNTQQLFDGVNAMESRGSYVSNDTTPGGSSSLSGFLEENINRHVILQHPVDAANTLLYNLVRDIFF